MAVDDRLPVAGPIRDRGGVDVARERLTFGRLADDRDARTGAEGPIVRGLEIDLPDLAAGGNPGGA